MEEHKHDWRYEPVQTERPVGNYSPLQGFRTWGRFRRYIPRYCIDCRTYEEVELLTEAAPKPLT